MGLTQNQRGMVLNCEIPESWDKHGFLYCSCQGSNTYVSLPPPPPPYVIHMDTLTIIVHILRCLVGFVLRKKREPKDETN